MKTKRIRLITAAFVVLVVLAVGLMLFNTLRRPPSIQLPEENPSSGQSGGNVSAEEGGLTVVAVTPKTVQAAIATLLRPETYSRKISVQQFWTGGDGTVETTVTVKAPWTRMDRPLADGRVRHTLTDGETTYIWYDRETSVYTAPAGNITADVEQSIPTYEDILDLPVERIAAADYQVISDVNCIYVETTEDDTGYVLRYWVSLDSGLLVAAEKLLGEETVYRMWQTSEDLSPAINQEFTLPDGTDVLAEED